MLNSTSSTRTKRAHMNAVNGPMVENERLLWHGTAAETAQVICHRGFNRSFCNLGVMYGKGVYFAREFCTSIWYARADMHMQKYMFQCRVLTGHYCTRSSSDIVEPPVRDKSRFVWLRSRQCRMSAYLCCFRTTRLFLNTWLCLRIEVVSNRSPHALTSL